MAEYTYQDFGEVLWDSCSQEALVKVGSKNEYATLEAGCIATSNTSSINYDESFAQYDDFITTFNRSQGLDDLTASQRTVAWYNFGIFIGEFSKSEINGNVNSSSSDTVWQIVISNAPCSGVCRVWHQYPDSGGEFAIAFYVNDGYIQTFYPYLSKSGLSKSGCVEVNQGSKVEIEVGEANEADVDVPLYCMFIPGKWPLS